MPKTMQIIARYGKNIKNKNWTKYNSSIAKERNRKLRYCLSQAGIRKEEG